jgi:hypothetical protein
MTRLLRAIRGAVGIAIVWAIPWAIAGFLASPILRRLSNAPPPGLLRSSLEYALDYATLMAWYGFLAGLAFSLVLSFAARRRVLGQLTTRQMAVWGVVASVLLTGPPMILALLNRSDGWRAGDPVWLGGGLLLSAGCAVGTLLLARKGAAPPAELGGERRAALAEAEVSLSSVAQRTRT